ncbi:hypothetical protein RB195_003910 [Necator americanus]|uniref:7TM GPCR serpentine receptor class x (Srx) domain-containing protein n=1 Tax=Necator americanus TaxID=51031 RepID=A0ABR1DRZ0_NECAM
MSSAGIYFGIHLDILSCINPPPVLCCLLFFYFGRSHVAYEGCSIYFNSERLLFVYSNTKCGELLALYGDFAAGVTMFSVCLLMDITSICYLRHMRNRVLNTLSTAKRKQRFRMEVVLTVQTFVNTSLYYVMIFSYHFGSELFNVHPMITFLSTNFLWCLVIASGGYTAVLICDELRDVILHPSHLYKGRKNSRQIVARTGIARFHYARFHYPRENVEIQEEQWVVTFAKRI